MRDSYKPLISIITIVYNGAEHLQEAIDSIRNQKYDNIEYIIIDGGSTDSTLDIIKRNNNIISSYISEKDNGISDAFNKGIRKANGEIIGLLNADDMYEDNALQYVVESYLANNMASGIYYGDIHYFNDDTSFSLIPDINKIWNYMSIFHPSTFVTKAVYDQVGLYSLEYRYAMDCELIHRCLKENVPFFYIDQVLSNFRLDGTSDVNYKKSYKEFYKSVNEHGKNKLAYFYYLLGIMKKGILRTKIGNYIKKNRQFLSSLMSGKYKKE